MLCPFCSTDSLQECQGGNDPRAGELEESSGAEVAKAVDESATTLLYFQNRLFTTVERLYKTPVFETLDWASLKKAQDEDSRIQKILSALKEGKTVDKVHCVNGQGLVGIRRVKGKFRVEIPVSLQHTVLHLAHGTEGQHRGRRPTMEMLSERVTWPGMSRDVRRWIRGCLDCRRRKTNEPRRHGLTGSLIQHKPWERLSIDFLLKELPISKEGYRFALVVMDDFTRWPIVIPLKAKDMMEIVDGLMDRVFAVHGLPKVVHSDNEFVLVSEAMDYIFKRLGVRRSTITFRHPQGNARVERFMRYINAAMTISLEKYEDWPRTVPMVLFAYRTLVHETTGYSAFSLMYGREPRLPLDVVLSGPEMLERFPEEEEPAVVAEYAQKLASNLKHAFHRVRRVQTEAAERNAARRDEGRVPVTFEEGDAVLLWDPESVTGTYGSERKEYPSVKGIPYKWRFNWSGPHVVEMKRNDQVYEILHSTRNQVFAVNVDKLIRYFPFKDATGTQPTRAIEDVEASRPPRRMVPRADRQTAADQVRVVPPGVPLELKNGELCALMLHDEEVEPLVAARYLGPVEEADQGARGDMLVQWKSSNQPNYAPEDKMRTQQWNDGWCDPKTAKFYWSKLKGHPSHVPYTNIWSDHKVYRRNVLCAGFGLNKNGTLPAAIADKVLDLWRGRMADVYAGENFAEPRSSSEMTSMLSCRFVVKKRKRSTSRERTGDGASFSTLGYNGQR